MRSRHLVPVLALLALALTTAPAAIAAGAAPAKVTSVEGITEYALDNGLKVLLFPDPSATTVTVNVTYFVGSRHEGYGEAGMAHLLEHMVFKGTPTHPSIWQSLEDHGASFNGTTWTDRTNYFETVPATEENLRWTVGMEADRMVNSSIAADELAKEFSVVRNEFEIGESYPMGVLEERMYASAFLWHGYGRSTIGSRSDIERVPADRLRAFYRRYYQPDNAMVVVAGKFDPAATLELVASTFGAIARPTRTLDATYTVEPAQDGERTVTLRRTGDVGAVGLMYHGVQGSHDDFVAERAAVDALTREPSGRLYKSLVESGLAARVYGTAYAWAEPGVLQCFAQVNKGKPLGPVKEAMIKAFDDLAANGIAQVELDRFKAGALKEHDLAMTDSGRIGVELSEWAAQGDWRLMFLYRDRVEKVTKEQVDAWARSYLKGANRTVGTFEPTDALDASPLPAAVDVTALVKGYQGREEMAAGTAFVATIDNIEATTVRGELPVGMRFAFVPKKTRGGAVQGQIALHVGSESDLKGKSVVAELLPEMLMRGTAKRDYQGIRDELDRLKAELSIRSEGLGVVVVEVKTVRDSLPGVLALVAEVLREPAFPAEQFEILKKDVLARYEEELQDPIGQGFSSLFRSMSDWPKGDVRYQPTTQEKIDLLKAATLADLKAFHAGLYGASRSEAAFVGDVDPAALKEQLSQHLGNWKSARPWARIEMPYRAAPAREVVVDIPGKEMAMLGMAHAIEAKDSDPEFPALEMINYVLGSSADSRLLNRLRQKEGLSYGAFSGMSAGVLDRSGSVYTGAFCAPQNLSRAQVAMREEVELMKGKGIDEAELTDAKASYKQGIDTQLSQDGYVVYLLRKGLYDGRTLGFHKELHASVAALSAEKVQRALDKHFHPEKLVIVKSGDMSAKAAPDAKAGEGAPPAKP